ncbi:PaaI family thioesterase [Pseudonocardia sp.]|uniref:PaaI family thioesterase n=1 Tax=Pseudonocardia sp. TaxID=60912 RepID=UPI003D0EAAC0
MVCPTHTDRPQRWRSSGCFACGDDPGGLGLTVTTGPGGRANGIWTVEQRHQGAAGIAHGGAVAAAFDEVLGAAQVHHVESAVTASLTTDFLRPVPVGAVVHLDAVVVAYEGRKLHIEGEARLDAPDGPLAARARGLFLAVPGEHFTRFGTEGPQHEAVAHEG